jgi:hypothetical protein
MEPNIPIPTRKCLPPRDTFVLAFEEGKGLWQAQHCPADGTADDGLTSRIRQHS